MPSGRPPFSVRRRIGALLRLDIDLVTTRRITCGDARNTHRLTAYHHVEPDLGDPQPLGGIAEVLVLMGAFYVQNYIRGSCCV